MIAFLLALAVPVLAQEAAKPAVAPAVTQVPGQVSQRTDYLESEVGQLLSGKPTITGVPNFQNGFAVNGVSGTPMLTTSTDTVSGAKTFVGSVTFSSTVVGACYGPIAWSSAAAVSSIKITSPVQIASGTIRLTWNGNFDAVASHTMGLLIDGDTGSNYVGRMDSNVTYTSYDASAQGFFEGTALGATAGDPVQGEAYFTTVFGYPKVTMWHGWSDIGSSGLGRYAAPITGHHNGSSPPTSITLQISAGTFHQIYLELWNCGQWKFQN